MSAKVVHLVRHGEVHNPQGILYGRLAGMGLSKTGEKMAAAAAKTLQLDGDNLARLVVSPLLRTQQSAAPIAEMFGLEPTIEDRIIEPWNKFEGKRLAGAELFKPGTLRHIYNPWRPSWGEPYQAIADRMFAAINDQLAQTTGGDLVLVTHQLPIVMVQRSVAAKKLAHDPRARRCELSSITTFTVSDNGEFREVNYRRPAAQLINQAKDTGAV